MHVVAVDDNKTIQQLLSITFALDEEIQGVVFAEGDAVIENIRTHCVDLFVIDWLMIPYHGSDLLRDIRSIPEHANTPIIILSAESEQSAKQEAKALGASGWMVKPFQPKQLINLVLKFKPTPPEPEAA
jgi:two-component system chemotaxis response regulator CheY